MAAGAIENASAAVDVPPCSYVIFGATGDLSSRKLIPALYALHRRKQLHPETQVVGFGRSDWDDEKLRESAREAIIEHGDGFHEESWRDFARRFHYQRGDYDSAASMRELRKLLAALKPPNRVFYTATPPATYAGLVEALAAAGLNGQDAAGWTRLVIEKPFGHDLDSARKLNDRIIGHFSEGQIYRIDHYLAKETAQNLAVMRFANTVFEPLWSNRYIDNVQITMAESVGVEGRGNFYEHSGVIRDVFQNHLLQLLALVAMEPPARYEATEVRNEKVKVLHALCCPGPADTVFGQYIAGNGMEGYRDEENVDPESRQATYAASRFEVRNWRWAGVPFFVRSGKRLEGKATEITLRFKSPPHIPFDLESPQRPDRLILRIAPDEGVVMRFNTKVPGQGIVLERANMEFSYARRFSRPIPDAYETLLLDTITGDATLFMRADEVEAQWRVVAPLLAEQANPGSEIYPYPAGSEGPPQAAQLLERFGRQWHRPGQGVYRDRKE